MEPSDAELVRSAVFLIFGVVWTTDVMAYFVGHALGGPKLWPAVSPKKTWSGAVGGAAAATLVGSGLSALAGLEVAALAPVCAVLSLAAQAGDLLESALKRRFGAKNASELIPGHGGLMDRLDGFVAAAMVAAFLGLAGTCLGLVLGLLAMEAHGTSFTREDLRDLWMYNLPVLATFGPERTVLLKAGVETLAETPRRDDPDWVRVLNPAEEYCGALIRVDAYGYACPGWSELAAELAWRDAGFTHRRTGVYAAMFVAAATALPSAAAAVRASRR